jgi:hypothetical protein
MNGICGLWNFRPFRLTLLSCYIVEICIDDSSNDRLEFGKTFWKSGGFDPQHLKIFQRSFDAGISGETSEYSTEADKFDNFAIGVL